MMTTEDAIKATLKTKFGERAYYGNDSSINWRELFINPIYKLYEEYGSVDEFREEIVAGNLRAANIVARIYRG